MVGCHGPFLCGAGAALGMSSLDWLPVTLGVGTLAARFLNTRAGHGALRLSLSLSLRFVFWALPFVSGLLLALGAGTPPGTSLVRMASTALCVCPLRFLGFCFFVDWSFAFCGRRGQHILLASPGRPVYQTVFVNLSLTNSTLPNALLARLPPSDLPHQSLTIKLVSTKLTSVNLHFSSSINFTSSIF